MNNRDLSENLRQAWLDRALDAQRDVLVAQSAPGLFSPAWALVSPSCTLDNRRRMEYAISQMQKW